MEQQWNRFSFAWLFESSWISESLRCLPPQQTFCPPTQILIFESTQLLLSSYLLLFFISHCLFPTSFREKHHQKLKSVKFCCSKVIWFFKHSSWLPCLHSFLRELRCIRPKNLRIVPSVSSKKYQQLLIDLHILIYASLQVSTGDSTKVPKFPLIN